MLPLSKIDTDKAKATPEMFTDTGVPALIEAVLEMGGRMSRLVVKVACGASPLDDKGLFRIGERNYTVFRKILWKNNILIAGEDVGGTKARTVFFHMDTGRTVVRSNGVEVEI
jgi:chemotaxis protein CheD